MSDNTKIDYLDATINPVAMRCEKVSDGCRNCWHLGMAKRLAGHQFPSDVRAAYAGGEPVLREDILMQPMRWKKPRTIGVQFMGDLFHDSIPFAWIDRILAMVAECERHTFLILTKRPARMVEYFQDDSLEDRITEYWQGDNEDRQTWNIMLPLPNLYLGVSVENQPATSRLDELAKLSALGWRTWASLEPLIGGVSLAHWLHPQEEETAGCATTRELDWVVCGGESGPNARPCHPDWIRSLRDQCAAASVPFWFKQWGEWVCAKEHKWSTNYDEIKSAFMNRHSREMEVLRITSNGTYIDDASREFDSRYMRWLAPNGGNHPCAQSLSPMARVGKHRAGAMLDGREHHERPGK